MENFRTQKASNSLTEEFIRIVKAGS
jgi:hypothetical protein